MKKVVKLLFATIVALFIFASCQKADVEEMMDDAHATTFNEVSAGVDTATSSGVVSEFGLSQKRLSPFWDGFLLVDLNNYSHIIEEESDFGLCGPLTFVLGKHLVDPSYPLTKEKANKVRRNCRGSVNPYTLWLQSNQDRSTFFSKVAGNNLWGNSRKEMKKFIYGQLSKGRPILVPCIYNMNTSPYSRNANHFYLIVGLMLRHDLDDDDYTYGGSGSLVLVKDVWRGGRNDKECEKTLSFSYSEFLNSVWYATQRKYNPDGSYSVVPGSESFSALSFSQ